jgi:hypothetical protein
VIAVMELANTSVTIFRGTTTTPLGDIIDSNDPLIEHVPAVLVETGRKTQDPSSSTPRTIRQITCTLPDWAQITNSDRLMDERTGDIYIIIDVTRAPDTFGPPPGILMSLKRVTAAGP